MVQDPVCKAYIPSGSAKSEKIGGQQYYFCSDECAEKFKIYMTDQEDIRKPKTDFLFLE